MTQGLRTRVRIGAAYTGDFGAQQRAVRALPAHARLPGVPRPSRLARVAALVSFALRRAVCRGEGDQP